MAAAGERQLVRLRRHVVCLVGPGVALVLVAAGTGALVGRTPSGPGRLVIALVALTLVLRLVLLPFARWRATTYVLTDQRVALATGVLHRVRRDVPFTRVDDVTVVQRLWQRPVAAGTVRVVAAGSREPLELADVPRVRLVQSTLLDAVAAAGTAATDGTRGR